MTEAEELADWVVSKGVGYKAEVTPYTRYFLSESTTREHFEARDFINDGRVVLAMIDIWLDSQRDRVEAWRRIDPQGNWNSFMVKPKKTGPAILTAIREAMT